MDEDMTVWLLIGGQSCWRCGVPNVVILGVEAAGFGVVEVGEELCEELASGEWETLRKRLRLGVLRPRWSKTAGRKYWPQGCAGCMPCSGNGHYTKHSRRPPQRAGTASAGSARSRSAGRRRFVVGDSLKARTREGRR